jgi:hypothetical protein
MIVLEPMMSTVFTDAFVRELAAIGNCRRGRLMVPPDFDIDRLRSGLRSAGRERTEMKCAPTHAKMRGEIRSLCGRSMAALERRTPKPFILVAQALSGLSPATRAFLSKDRLHALPEVGALRDPAKREHACKVIVGLCARGFTFDRNGTTLIEFNEPPLRRSKKRDADRLFVGLIQEAWCSAGGVPAWNSNYEEPGPFAKMVAKCLQAVGAVGDKAAKHAQSVAVDLINQLERERRGTLSAELVRTERGIMNALRTGPKARSEIYRLFRPRLRRLRRPGGEFISAVDLIKAALDDLKVNGYVTRQRRRTRGRSLEVWSLIPASRTARDDGAVRRLPHTASVTV